jgi:hypothetical protein
VPVKVALCVAVSVIVSVTVSVAVSVIVGVSVGVAERTPAVNASSSVSKNFFMLLLLKNQTHKISVERGLLT